MRNFLSISIANGEKLQSTWELALEEIKNLERALNHQANQLSALERERELEQKEQAELQESKEKIALREAFLEYEKICRQERIGKLLGIAADNPEFFQKASEAAIKYLSNLLIQKYKEKSIKITKKQAEFVLTAYLFKIKKERKYFDILDFLDCLSQSDEAKISALDHKGIAAEITQTEVEIYKILDEEHAEKLMFLIYELARNPKKNIRLSFDEQKKELSQLRENINTRYQRGGLHEVIEQRGKKLEGRLNWTDYINNILESYIEKKFKSKKDKIMAHMSPIILRLSEQTIAEDFGYWRDQFDDKTIGLLAKQALIIHVNAKTDLPAILVKEDVFKHPILQQYLKKEILEALNDPMAILEYLKEVLSQFLRSKNSKASPELYDKNFKKWLNLHFYGHEESPASDITQKKAKSFFHFQQYLIKEGLAEDNKMLEFLKKFVQNKHNPQEVSQAAICLGLPEVKSLTTDLIHPECADIESALKQLTLEPNIDQQAILREALTLEVLEAKELAFIPEKLPESVQFQRIYTEKRRAITPIKESKNAAERNQKIEEKAIENRKIALELSEKNDLLKKTEEILLSLIKYQTLAALFDYHAAEKSWLFHRGSGLEQAKKLLKSLISPNISLKQGLESLTTFLKNEPNLRDQSFATYLLSQMFSNQGGVLESELNLEIKGGVTKLYDFAIKTREAFRNHDSLIQEVVTGDNLEKLLEEETMLKTLAGQYRRLKKDRVDLAIDAKSPQGQILQPNVWKNGPGGRWMNLLCFKPVENIRRDAEETALQRLDTFNTTFSRK